ncbi:MAG TPA: hypothetical protein VFY23_14945, partial [Candidatus Limnocylindrales bacterium]|nr:hypothetical protein [Candidatus Limnocylindrales bacterium]
ARVVALSRHGEIPRSHEDPWRPRPATPAMTVDEFAAAEDKIAAVRARVAESPLGWRQALDSMRPIHRELWLAMDDGTRRRFLDLRREWEVHRSRLAPGVEREVRAWEAEGRLEIRAARIGRIVASTAGLRIEVDGDRALHVDHLLLATGPSESPAESPLLASTMATGLARPGPFDLGIDVHPYDLRVRDADGGEARPVWALGPVVRGSVWECIAIPEIRLQAVRIAEQVVAGPAP